MPVDVSLFYFHILPAMTWCNPKWYQEVVPDWRGLDETDVGYDIQESSVGPHFPYTLPLSSWVFLLLLGIDI